VAQNNTKHTPIDVHFSNGQSCVSVLNSSAQPVAPSGILECKDSLTIHYSSIVIVLLPTGLFALSNPRKEHILNSSSETVVPSGILE